MTQCVGSKADVINNEYLLADVLQLNGLTTAQITARAPADVNGTIYHDSTVNKLKVKLNGSVETITSS